jgi:hypothetical protein
MNAPLTISYSDDVQGWTSFWTFMPEYMIYAKNNFYSFKAGNLYMHNDEGAPRTIYYPGTVFQTSPYCSISTLFNDNPFDIKMFDTISIQSQIPWNTSVSTNLISGEIDDTWFSLKEGFYYGYIRRNQNPVGALLTNISQLDDKLSTRIIGVGVVLNSGPNTPGPIVGYVRINTFPDPNLMVLNISAPDQLYIYNAVNGNLTFVGDVYSVDNVSAAEPIIYLSSVVTLPNAGDNILAIKGSVAESYGARGYFMDVTLNHNSTSFVELFEISSSAFKSFM